MPNLRREQKITLFIGAFFVAVGVLLISFIVTGGNADFATWIPLATGILFCIAGAFIHEPSLFVPAGFLLGAGLGLVLVMTAALTQSDSEKAALFLLCFSGGWLIVPVMTRLFSPRTIVWPAIPGLAGVIIGVLLYL